MKKWSLKFDNCIQCGLSEKIHVARGLCKTCYTVDIENSHKDYKKHKRGVVEDYLTKDKLTELYILKEMSLSDIGKLVGTTRQNVYYKLKRYNIPTRSKKKSRIIALDKGKIKHSFVNEEGITEIKTLRKIRFNEVFFETWSNEMAYVLGLIYTDGNVDFRNLKKSNSSGAYKQGRLSFGQKEKELVEKVLNLMDCDVKISYKKKRILADTVAGEMNYFHINSNKLYKQLVSFGLKPNKSLTIDFPEVPPEYLRHFIRGCWDGDGYVGLDRGRLALAFVSGSIKFIKKIQENLEELGLTKRNLFVNKNGQSYSFKYNRYDLILFRLPSGFNF